MELRNLCSRLSSESADGIRLKEAGLGPKPLHRITSVINRISTHAFESGTYFLFFPDLSWSLLPFEEAESPNSAHVTLLETSAPFSFCDLAGTGKEQRTESTSLRLFALSCSNVPNFISNTLMKGSIFFQ